MTGIAEGGLMIRTNLASDPGKETVGGISRRWNPKLELWGWVDSLGVTARSATNLEAMRDSFPEAVENIERLVLSFYHNKGYLWKKTTHVTGIENQGVAAKVFDVRFHAGTAMWKSAVKAIQRAVGANDDGTFGPGTLGLVNQFTEVEPDAPDAPWKEPWLRTLLHSDAIINAIALSMTEFYVRKVQRKTKELAVEYAQMVDSEFGLPEGTSIENEATDNYNRTGAQNLLGHVRRAHHLVRTGDDE